MASACYGKTFGSPEACTNLERIEHRHEPASCQCGQCGTDLVKIGEDVSEQLDVEPARFFVHRHIRPVSVKALPSERTGTMPISFEAD